MEVAGGLLTKSTMGKVQGCLKPQEVFMKTMIRIYGAVSASISLLVASSALAEGGFDGSHSGGGSDGYRGGWGGSVVSFGFGGPYYYGDYPATYLQE